MWIGETWDCTISSRTHGGVGCSLNKVEIVGAHEVPSEKR